VLTLEAIVSFPNRQYLLLNLKTHNPSHEDLAHPYEPTDSAYGMVHMGKMLPHIAFQQLL